MKRCRLPRWLAAIALPLLLPCAQATTVVPRDFDQLVNRADYVVRATVKTVTSEWRHQPDRPGSRHIASLVTLEVHEILKGEPPSPLVLDFVGGRIGETELEIEGSPRLRPGEESFLFVRGNGRQLVPLVGMSQGHFPVRRDQATGRALVLRHDGRYLYHESEINRAGEARPVRHPRAEPLTASEFSGLVRSAIRIQEDTRERRH